MFNRGHFIEKELERRIRDRNFRAVQSLFPRLSKESRNWRNEHGESFLHIALSVCDETIFNWLYERFENSFMVMTLDNKGRSLPWLAVQKHKLDLAMRLIANQYGAPAFAASPFLHDWIVSEKPNVSILHLAAQEPTSELLEFLIPFLPNEPERSSISLLLFSAQAKRGRFVLIDRADGQGKSPLHYASEAKAFDNIVVLVNIGADLDLIDEKNNCFLSWFETSDQISEEERVLLFKRFDNEKRFQILSYLRSQGSELYARLAAEQSALLEGGDLEAALDEFERRTKKSFYRVLRDDKRTIENLIDKVDARLTELNARPVPKVSFSWMYKIAGKLFDLFGWISTFATVSWWFLFLGETASVPLSILASFVGISLATASATTFALLGIAAMCVGILGAVIAVACFKIGTAITNKANSPVLQISHEEFTELKDVIEKEIIIKCKTVNSKRPVPVYQDLLKPLEDFISSFEDKNISSPIDLVVDTLTNIKFNLIIFRDKVIRNKAPISLVTDVAEVAAPVRVATTTPVSRHWAALHTEKVDEKENVSVAEVEKTVTLTINGNQS
jgi:hypothetical protein